MNPLAYLGLIRRDRLGGFIVTFPDIPEAITQGNTTDEAEVNAADALAAALENYLKVGRSWPVATKPSPAPDERAVDVPVAPDLAARAARSL